MGMFTILPVVMVSQVCVRQNLANCTLQLSSLLYVNYTSIKLIGKRKKKEIVFLPLLCERDLLVYHVSIVQTMSVVLGPQGSAYYQSEHTLLQRQILLS